MTNTPTPDTLPTMDNVDCKQEITDIVWKLASASVNYGEKQNGIPVKEADQAIHQLEQLMAREHQQPVGDAIEIKVAADIPTVASCSGHGEREGGIALKDGRELIIAKDFDGARRIDRLIQPRLNKDEHTKLLAIHMLESLRDDIACEKEATVYQVLNSHIAGIKAEHTEKGTV